MEQNIITFTADEQALKKTGGISNYASDTVGYVSAVFTLGENWTGYDEIRAVWKNTTGTYPSVLNSRGQCDVPTEVLAVKGEVRVNLVGSIITSEEVTGRLTTYSVRAFTVGEDVPVDGSDPQPITPSEYEQFVAKVKEDARSAEASARASREYAESAEQGAGDANESAQRAKDAQEEASEYAENAQNSALQAQNAKDDANTYAQQAEDARDVILGMTAEATTLPSGSEATASYSGGVMSFGIPKGDTGDKGDTGATGATPDFSIGTVETLEPNESATASITGTTDNPVLNLGIPKGAQGDVNMAQLEQVLPTDSASGSIATFPDGTSLFPAKAVKVSLEPIQDLHGYDKPWSGGNGKNKLNPTEAFGDYSSYTVNADGSVTVTAGDSRSWANMTAIPLKAGTYILSRDIANGMTAIRTSDDDYASDVKLIWQNQTSNGAFTLASDGGVKIKANYSGTYPATFKFQLEEGSTATSWTPYSNECPISGRTGCEVDVTGKNLLPNVYSGGSSYTVNGITYTNDDGVVKVSGTPTGNAYYTMFPNTDGQRLPLKAGTYTISCAETTANCRVNFNIVGVASSVLNGNQHSYTFTASSDAEMYANILTDGSSAVNLSLHIQIEKGSTATAYEPYHGNTYPISWQTEAGTVYGADVEAVEGELVDKMGMVDLGSLTWIRTSTAQGGYRWYSAGVVNSVKKPSSLSTKANILSDIYPTIAGNEPNQSVDGIAIHTNGNILIYDQRYDDASVTTADFKTAMSGVQLCYELAQPQTYTLTETEIALFDGTNNVWSDSGDVEVTYKADVQKWVEKKLG